MDIVWILFDNVFLWLLRAFVVLVAPLLRPLSSRVIEKIRFLARRRRRLITLFLSLFPVLREVF